jgi:hypothetical protein
MADDGAQRLAVEAIRDCGYLYPEWRLGAEQGPDVRAAYNACYREALDRDAGHGATPAEVLGAPDAAAIPGGAVSFLKGRPGLVKVQEAPAGAPAAR